MPVPRDYYEGMISPPIVSPEVVGPNNVRVDQELYRQAQETIGLTAAERAALSTEQVRPHIAEVTTPAAEVAAKQTAVDAAMSEAYVPPEPEV